MPHTSSQTFLRELDKKLWTAADRLRSNLDAAVYKHAVLGLIFLSRVERVRVPARGARRVRAGARIKYVSDSFAQRQAEIEAMLKDPENDFFVNPDGYDKPKAAKKGSTDIPVCSSAYEEAIHRELEERDYYIEKNVFWVPALARWKTLQDSAKLPAGTEIKERGRLAHSYKFTSLGKLIDDALEAVEKENPNGAERHRRPSNVARRVRAGARIKLKNVLNKNYTQLQIDPANLAGLIDLIDLIATIPFQHADLHAKDILGHPTESSCSNSSSASLGDLCAFAVQISSPRMATGMSPLPDTFTRDQHPDLRADFVMALPSAAARSLPRSHTADRPNGRINPPFNIKEWSDGKLEGDARWNRSGAELASHFQFYKNRGKYGTPPQTATRECAPLKSEGSPQVVSEARDKNANFAWVQHMLHHLAPNGSMALLLANGSMSSNSSGEGDIRRALIEADLVECMVALPGQLFTNTQIPACIWFLTKNKAMRSRPGAAALRDRRGETLFIDARNFCPGQGEFLLVN